MASKLHLKFDAGRHFLMIFKIYSMTRDILNRSKYIYYIFILFSLFYLYLLETLIYNIYNIFKIT